MPGMSPLGVLADAGAALDVRFGRAFASFLL
jgi:hypothetical protein